MSARSVDLGALLPGVAVPILRARRRQTWRGRRRARPPASGRRGRTGRGRHRTVVAWSCPGAQGGGLATGVSRPPRVHAPTWPSSLWTECAACLAVLVMTRPPGVVVSGRGPARVPPTRPARRMRLSTSCSAAAYPQPRVPHTCRASGPPPAPHRTAPRPSAAAVRVSVPRNAAIYLATKRRGDGPLPLVPRAHLFPRTCRVCAGRRVAAAAASLPPPSRCRRRPAALTHRRRRVWANAATWPVAQPERSGGAWTAPSTAHVNGPCGCGGAWTAPCACGWETHGRYM